MCLINLETLTGERLPYRMKVIPVLLRGWVLWLYSRLAMMNGITSDSHWVNIWATAVAQSRPAYPFQPYAIQNDGLALLENTTIRQTLRVSLGAEKIRVRISNDYADGVLPLSAVTVAVPTPQNGTTAGSSTVKSGSIVPVTFAGYHSVDVPAGADIVTDPIPLSVSSDSDITVSMYLADGHKSSSIAVHGSAKSVSWVASGDHTKSGSLPEAYTTVPFKEWLYISTIEGVLPTTKSAVACFGDSITDRGDSLLPINQYFGWTDYLFARLQNKSSTSDLSVVNLGIGGDRIYEGGLRRFDRDVISHSGVKYIFILMGINDIGNAPNTTAGQDMVYRRIRMSFDQIIKKGHSAGIPVFGSTILPFLCPPGWLSPSPYVDSLREETRLKLNDWIMHEADFDYVVDWSTVVADPEHPHFMRKSYQYTDYVHPSPEGYRAMADAVDLGVFERVGLRGE